MTTEMTSPSRVQGIDIARGFALLGIIVNHIFYIAYRPAADALQDYHAVLFMLLAGIVYTYAEGSNPVLKNRVRGIFCIILGLALGAGNPQLVVILLNYGWTFIIASFFVHKMKARPLFILSAIWIMVSPIVSLLIRNMAGTRHGENIGFQHFASEPWLFIIDPILWSNYPVLQWFAVFLFGAALGRTDIRQWLGDVNSTVRTLVASVVVFLLVKLSSGAIGSVLIGISFMEAMRKNFRLDATLGSL